MTLHTFTPAAPARWADLDTEGRAAAIIALHGQTSDEIAAHLGTTRNAVLGLAHRRDILLDSGRVYARNRFKPHPLPADETWAPLRPSTPSPTRKQCCWPVGEATGSNQQYCGGPRARGSYCTHHAAMAFRPTHPADTKYTDMLKGGKVLSGVEPGITAAEALAVVLPKGKMEVSDE